MPDQADPAWASALTVIRVHHVGIVVRDADMVDPNDG